MQKPTTKDNNKTIALLCKQVFDFLLTETFTRVLIKLKL